MTQHGDELERRMQIWTACKASGGPDGVRPEMVKELRIHRGQQSVFRDLELTGTLTDDLSGVTVGLLHTGSSYAADLSEDGIVYHYPVTNRGLRDGNEIAATKACGRLGLPLFVIVTPVSGSLVRNVHLGWVIDFDDRSSEILIKFSETAQSCAPFVQDYSHELPFRLHRDDLRGDTLARSRPNQWRFRFDALKRYGPTCTVCDVRYSDLVQAAHLCPVQFNGCDDPRNALIFCLNHHRAFDLGLFRIHPETLAVHVEETEQRDDLGIRVGSIRHLPNLPHVDALRWVWNQGLG